jgi:hypothetical protein
VYRTLCQRAGKTFPENLKFFTATKSGRTSFKTRKGLVTSSQMVPAQTKKKKKLGQFSGSKPSGLSPQRALLNLGRPWTSPDFGPFGTECGSFLSLRWEKLTYFNECYQNPIESVTDSGVIIN